MPSVLPTICLETESFFHDITSQLPFRILQMEKVYVGWSTSSSYWSPAIQIMLAAIFTVLTVIAEIHLLVEQQFIEAAAIPVVLYILVEFVYMRTAPADTNKYLSFPDKSWGKRWGKCRIPMSTLVTGYLDGKVDFKGDVLDVLRERDQFASYKVTPETFSFLLKQFLPVVGVSSSHYDKKTSKREIADHYDRDCEFFNAFLGPAMVYTCAIWHNHKTETLEAAQARKMNLVCKKLQLKPGHKYLDIGCGWGSLAIHAEKHFGAKATGVTLSIEGANYARQASEKAGTNVEILTMDYRDIPAWRKFDRISAIEMAEHVGIANFQKFLGQVKAHLADDGVFLMQVAGLRQGSNFQDIAWGLFMARYIFPAADASTPLHWYVRQLELAGFEVRSVETIGRHYSHTLHRWYLNFLKNEQALLATGKYDQRLINLWKIFLAWSVIASGQGSATCYQIVAIKNTYKFDRDRFVGEDVEGNRVDPNPLK
jgi:cyclopropane fatty-acyl-phospholipid synthase-like methyltransferase